MTRPNLEHGLKKQPPIVSKAAQPSSILASLTVNNAPSHHPSQLRRPVAALHLPTRGGNLEGLRDRPTGRGLRAGKAHQTQFHQNPSTSLGVDDDTFHSISDLHEPPSNALSGKEARKEGGPESMDALGIKSDGTVNKKPDDEEEAPAAGTRRVTEEANSKMWPRTWASRLRLQQGE
jgi:hypothetical protein